MLEEAFKLKNQLNKVKNYRRLYQLIKAKLQLQMLDNKSITARVFKSMLMLKEYQLKRIKTPSDSKRRFNKGQCNLTKVPIKSER